MSNTVIKVEDLSKQYRLGEVSTGTLSHDINRWWHKIQGKENPYLKIGEANDRSQKGNSEYVWALKDIGFEMQKGELLGIIGRNGAGKSTLLKILSRTTTPTRGTVKIKGRVASLLEVGTGFHPELSGRDNIFLNGAILGMTRQEIRHKFDEIVDFAGVERYIDTPVKRYSSGMYVRLAFAVAAFLEPEILIVDEVLAVGDAEFQKKCLGKMKDVSNNEGRTILFVSHNMGAIAQLCNKGIVMHQGTIVYQGLVRAAINQYMEFGAKEAPSQYINTSPKDSDILGVTLCKDSGQPTASFMFNESVILQITIKVEDRFINAALIGFRVVDKSERNVFTTQVKISDYVKTAGTYIFNVCIPKGMLVPNVYLPVIYMHIPNVQVLTYLESAVQFEIEETGTDFFQYAGNDYGCVFADCKWNLT